MGDTTAERLASHPRWRAAVLAYGDGILVRHDDGSLWRARRARAERGELRFVCWDDTWGVLVPGGTKLVTVMASDEGALVPDLLDAATQGCLLSILGPRLEFLEHVRGVGYEVWLVVRQTKHGPVVGSEKAPTRGHALARAVLRMWEEEADSPA